MIIITSIRPGTWCIRRLAVRNPRSGPRSVAMAASAFQSTTVERAPITAVLPTGIEPSLGIAGLLFHKIGARLRRRPRRILS
jgi:hypothetical protein